MWQSRVVIFRFTPGAEAATVTMSLAAQGRARGNVLASLQTPSVSECIIKHNYAKFFSPGIARSVDIEPVVKHGYFSRLLGHRDAVAR